MPEREGLSRGFLAVPGMGSVEVIADERRVHAVEIHNGADLGRVRDSITARYLVELEEYFEGERREFDWPLSFEGLPPFRRSVLETLRGVAYGRTITYGELAAKAGNPGAARATGQAVGANPFGIVVPCHRVLASGGRLGGYGGGLSVKVFLLDLEARFGAGAQT